MPIIYISYTCVCIYIYISIYAHVYIYIYILHGFMCLVAPQGLSLPLAVRKRACFLTACRKQAKTRFPLQLSGAYRSRATTLANHLAASRNYEHSCTNIDVYLCINIYIYIHTYIYMYIYIYNVVTERPLERVVSNARPPQVALVG